jgi:hypothetical protein
VDHLPVTFRGRLRLKNYCSSLLLALVCAKKRAIQND